MDSKSVAIDFDASHKKEGETVVELGPSGGEGYGICAICLDVICLQEIAIIKNCEHIYCVTCILNWATYKDEPLCPQCKIPFESLHLHKSLDGCIHDFMIEESVHLLRHASWFAPLKFEDTDFVGELEIPYNQYVYEENNEYADYADDDYEDYLENSLSHIFIGNRKWGNNGFVRTGRKEARPIQHNCNAGSSRPPMETSKDSTGRRARRTRKRAVANKVIAEASLNMMH
ncbi:E3 ubiquitin-protein ligase ICP0 [Zostera marina]|uniref:E3 ubiquitin-protein ligase ICP0 n=1 Tax=Zostera marina TaxID=29655 RepID=A0A0K9NGM2_ZOSMR|nr:E3 ubiquitin-protein ligase ICP0 [Zostera marina]